MAKKHLKNGFEYFHERHFFGSWVHYWYLRPQGLINWMPFNTPIGTAKKVDVENFLNNKEEADKSYKEWLDRVGDIELAKKNLRDAESHLARISEPDWGGRGNNPDRDVRITKRARADVDCARRALSFAEKINSQK